MSRLTIHRSADGLTWTGPIDAALAEQRNLAYDKNWLTCDNGPASPFRGRCYLAYTLVGDPRDDLAVQRSDDGGRTWSAAVTVSTPVTGVIPVVRPDGTLVLPFWSERSGMFAVISKDGGVTLGNPIMISELRATDVRPLRGATAHRRRRRPRRPAARPSGRTAGSALRARATTSSSRSRSDGTTWSAPVRVTRGRNVAIPTIGIEPANGRLAIAYYVIRPGGIDAELVTSANGGATWSAPQRLTPRTMPLTWMPDTTLGRMLADYIGVSWARGRPLVVYALASPPRNGKLRQAIYAAARLSAE